MDTVLIINSGGPHQGPESPSWVLFHDIDQLSLELLSKLCSYKNNSHLLTNQIQTLSVVVQPTNHVVNEYVLSVES